ncbi:hypothetical protein HU200_021875 [Digitaria exilis]|uniref:DUF3615 domain-containing protein n=1 Tax=Digitaria exilis TaxID=1010633 RepID=A0A835EZ19_9POAL|nr:hypothetical protein HU200_021875 [Digitaria exilis]
MSNHDGRLRALKTMECKGKSKFFLEHQALLQEGKKGYDPSVHSWRFAQQVPLPEGKWPPLWKYSKIPLDEHEKEERAKQNREEKEQLDEELWRHRRIETELQRRKKQFPPGKAPSDKQLRKEVVREYRLARAQERHVKNVQMAVRIINRRYPDKKYDLREITAKSSIYELGSAYYHYNFTVYSPTDGPEFFFAETDIDPECEPQVYQCCKIGSGPHGCCMGCLKEGVGLIHPSSDKFIAGHESFDGFCTDSDSDDDY